MSKIQVLKTRNLNEEILEFAQKHKNEADFDEKFATFLEEKSRWLRIHSVEYSTGNRTSCWTYASRKKTPNSGVLKADAVVIVPFVKQDDRFKLVMIKEFRVPISGYEFGFPAGLYDHNETAEEVARRELREETGLEIDEIIHVSPPVVSSAGMSDESIVYVFCRCSGEPHTDGNEESEDIQVQFLDAQEIDNFLQTNTDAISAKAYPFLMMFEIIQDKMSQNRKKM